MTEPLSALRNHQLRLRRCRRCPGMTGPPVSGAALLSPVMVVGQAPGRKEITLGRPFAWTAGKTLFGWFSAIGLAEAEVRERVFMTAVCRCFPGKNGGGDRVPSRQEVDNCAAWLRREMELLRPELIIPVGGLAIRRFMPVAALRDVVGQAWPLQIQGRSSTLIPLPHPSGASTWHRTEPGKSLLRQALRLIEAHPAWTRLRDGD